MKSKVEGRNYIILNNDDKYPVKINKKKTDKSIDRLLTSLTTFCNEVKDIYKDNYGLYSILGGSLDYMTHGDWDEGHCWRLNSMLEDLETLKNNLASNNDEIPDIEDVVTLDDLGYSIPLQCDSSPLFWEKKIEDTEKREIVEEIWCFQEPIRRIRTIEWEKTDYGRTSKKISYKKIPIGKKLMKAIKNSIKEKTD